MRRQFCQQDGAEQQRERAAPPGHVCASAHGGASGAQSRFAGADCPAGQPCRPADRRAHCPADCRAPCRADFRMESVHVSPPLPLRQCMHCGAFSCGRGDCPAGASPLESPGLNPGGAYSPNKKGTRRGACLVCRLPTMPLVYFLSPIPPPPFPSGEGGEIIVFLCKGLRPLHPRARAGGGTCTTKEFCMSTGAVPAAKERGDRGRWNYPSLTRRRRLRWSSPPGQG